METFFALLAVSAGISTVTGEPHQTDNEADIWIFFCLVRPGVRDKRRVSEIGLSQPRHEKGFWWRRNGPVTSQLTELQYFEQVLPV